jgi:hypothetical protein
MIYRTKVWRWAGDNRFFVRYVPPQERVDLEFNGFIVGLKENATTGELTIWVQPNRERASDMTVPAPGFSMNGSALMGKLKVIMRGKDARKG